MDKRKKGFTIPELLAVIVILGVLALIAGATYSGISRQLKNSILEQKISFYKEKALEYAADNDITGETITLNGLIELGYVDMEHPENNKYETIDNPVTGGYLDCMHFTIERDYGDYTVTSDDDGKCDLAAEESVKNNVVIKKYVYDGEFKLIEDEWVNKAVYVLVDFSNIKFGYGGYSIENDKIDYVVNGQTKTSNGKVCQNIYTSNPDVTCMNVFKIDDVGVFNNDIIVSFGLKNSNAKSNKVTKKVNIKIDHEIPTLEVSYNPAYTTDSIPIKLVGEDGSGSGIVGYYFSESRSYNVDNFEENNEFYASSNGKYYAYTMDNTGNVSEVKEININSIDVKGPEPFIRYEARTSWTTKDLTVEFGCNTDAKSGCANEITYQIWDTTSRIFTKTLVPQTTVQATNGSYTFSVPDESSMRSGRIKFTIKDNLGNTTTKTYNINVLIDKVSPQFAVNISKKKNKSCFLFVCVLNGYDYTATISIKNSSKIPSKIKTRGYSYRITDLDYLNSHEASYFDSYFSNSAKYYTYVAKKDEEYFVARVVTGSGKVSYAKRYVDGHGCTNYVGYTLGGVLIGTILTAGTPLWMIVGGIVGWFTCAGK